MTARARASGRDPARLTGAQYLTFAIDDDRARAERRLDDFMAEYYGPGSEAMRRSPTCYAGPLSGARDLLAAYAEAGASHFVLRFAGDQHRHLDLCAGLGA